MVKRLLGKRCISLPPDKLTFKYILFILNLEEHDINASSFVVVFYFFLIIVLI